MRSRYTQENHFRFNQTEIYYQSYLYAPLIRLAEPPNKNTLIGERDDLDRFFRQELRSERPSIYAIDENVRSVHYCLVFRPFNVFYERFNELILRMVSSGLIKKLESENSPFGSNKKSEDIGPQVLSMDSIGFGFILTAALWSLSFLVFLIEIFVHEMKKLFD